jgi:hypothetical protein
MMSPRKRNTGSQAVRTGRWMARRDEPFAVFLFGMRLNRLRGLPRFLWGLRVLRRVLRDLEAHPQRGYVAGRVYRAGRTLVAVQYWESFDALDAWARDHRLPHRRPWQQYLREALDDGAMGLWHETYLASPGSWEGVYLNMPPWGLAAGVEAVEMQTTKGSARERLREQRKRAGRAAEKTPPPAALTPSLLLYLFGAVILAATINLVAGLATKPSAVVGWAGMRASPELYRGPGSGWLSASCCWTRLASTSNTPT